MLFSTPNIRWKLWNKSTTDDHSSKMCPKVGTGRYGKPIDLKSQVKAATVNPPKHSKTFATKITCLPSATERKKRDNIN